MVEALVAGHICLDIIPGFLGKVAFDPGRLIEVGEATLSTGGAVSNTGQALHKLGIETSLCGKVGQDLFGDAIRQILERTGEGLSQGMKISPGEASSYTVVISLSGEDRMFLHAPGCNDSFVAADVSDEALTNTKLIHFGYPTLMARMFADVGAETLALLKRAKALGATTSLDVSLPDIRGAAGKANWLKILEQALPYTDLFLPSVEELHFMLDLPSYDPNDTEQLSVDRIRELTRRAMSMGAKVVAVKAGSRGLYLAGRQDLSDLGRATPTCVSEWKGAELWAPCFQVDVAGTTGAGDATIAGLLMAWLRNMAPIEAAKAATAIGAACCERPDAVTGVPSWVNAEQRIHAGWQTAKGDLGADWELVKGVYIPSAK